MGGEKSSSQHRNDVPGMYQQFFRSMTAAIVKIAKIANAQDHDDDRGV